MTGGEGDDVPEMERDGCVHGCSAALQDEIQNDDCSKICEATFNQTWGGEKDLNEEEGEGEFSIPVFG